MRSSKLGLVAKFKIMKTTSIAATLAAIIISSTVSVHSSADGKQDVVAELVYCSSLCKGLSITVVKSKKADMESLARSFMEMALFTSDNDQKMVEAALKSTADRAAAKIVGTTPEARFAAMQECRRFLKEGAIEAEIANRNEKK